MKERKARVPVLRKSQETEVPQRPRRVMIATPVGSDERTSIYYSDSLASTIKALWPTVEVFHFFITGNLCHARNQFVQLAVEGKVDDLLFVDSDMAWTPQDVIRLIGHEEHVVSGVYRRKDDEQTIVALPKTDVAPDEKGRLEVRAAGTGFLRIDRAAYLKLWAGSETYERGGKKFRAVFEGNNLETDEDFSMCDRWRKMKGKIYLDTQVMVGHHGTKLYRVENK